MKDMCSDDKYWLGFNTLVTIILCTMIVTCGVNWHNTTERKAEAIQRGGDPLSVYCLFEASSQNQICTVLATQQRSK